MLKLTCALSSLALLASAQPAHAANPQVEIDTTMGKIVIELNQEKAPQSAKNFLAYVNSGFYDGTIFHRVIKTFMIQGGGLTADMKKKPTQKPIQNEADNGLKNDKYTVAMARTGDPHSATAQFFINTSGNNGFLNHKSKTQRGWGYAVFGKVVSGTDVVDKIAAVKTGMKTGRKDVPVETVTIKSAKLVEKKSAKKK